MEMSGNNNERHYWTIHEDTLWRYALQKEIVDEKWKVEGFTLSLAGIISGKIKIESLPEITRFKILHKLLNTLEDKNYILDYNKRIKELKDEDMYSKSPKFDDSYKKQIDYEVSKKLFKLYGTLHINGTFENKEGEIIGNFYPLSDGKSRYDTSIPVLFDRKTKIDDVRIPPYDQWSKFYIVLIGSISYNSKAVIKALTIYRDYMDISKCFSEIINGQIPSSDFLKSDFLAEKDFKKIDSGINTIVKTYLINIFSKKGWKVEFNLDREIFEINDVVSNIGQILGSEKDGDVKSKDLKYDIESRMVLSSANIEYLFFMNHLNNNVLKIKEKIYEDDDFKEFINNILDVIEIKYSIFEKKLNNYLAYGYKKLKMLVDLENKK